MDQFIVLLPDGAHSHIELIETERVEMIMGDWKACRIHWA